MEKSFIKDIINDFPGTSVRSVLCSVFKYLGNSSRLDESTSLFDDISVSVGAINDHYHKLSAIESLSRSLIQCDKIDDPI